jgi:hypothetical protein
MAGLDPAIHEAARVIDVDAWAFAVPKRLRAAQAGRGMTE